MTWLDALEVMAWICVGVSAGYLFLVLLHFIFFENGEH